MADDANFEGWCLEGWSLQHGLLELYFHFWPIFEVDADVASYEQMHPNQCYKGKVVFSRPARIAFSHFSGGAHISSKVKVEEAVISSSNEKGVSYRLSLSRGAGVEVEAGDYFSVRW
jgi:hypothetical protein